MDPKVSVLPTTPQRPTFMDLCNRWWRHSISCKLLSTSTITFKSFELSTVTIKLPHSLMALYYIYRPPQSTTKSRHSCLSFSFKKTFTLLSHLYQLLLMNSLSTATSTLMLMILLTAIQFLSLLDYANLTQLVSFPTHRHSYTLDLVIMSANYFIFHDFFFACFPYISLSTHIH